MIHYKSCVTDFVVSPVVGEQIFFCPICLLS